MTKISEKKFFDISDESSDANIRIYSGDGDSALFKFKNFNILIDGGKGKDGNVMYEDIQVVDLVILTHGDNDHLNGIDSLVNSSTAAIKRFWTPFGTVARGWKHVITLKNKVIEKKIEFCSPTQGTTFIFGELKIVVVLPDQTFQKRTDEIIKEVIKLNKEKEYKNKYKDKLTEINKYGLCFYIEAGDKDICSLGIVMERILSKD